MQYQINGKTVTLAQQADGTWRAQVGDGNVHHLHIRAAADGGIVLRSTDGGAQSTAYSAAGARGTASEAERYVYLDGATYTLTLDDGAPRRKRAGKGSAEGGTLAAQMPGQVTQVLVSVGDAVRKGQPLLVMEAMKMEIRIAAPLDGVVRALHVAKGALVERGQALADVGADVANTGESAS
jgi:3-methylcrotonyl-CoA carboxylase alpha subunit